MTDFAEILGARIRDAREARGWTQQHLADELGCTQTAVSYWEGGRRSMSAEDLVRVAEALGRPHLLASTGERRFDHDPEALAWARDKVQHCLDKYRGFEAKRLADGVTPQPYRAIAHVLARDLIGGEGCVIAAFDERYPQMLGAARAAEPKPPADTSWVQMEGGQP